MRFNRCRKKPPLSLAYQTKSKHILLTPVHVSSKAKHQSGAEQGLLKSHARKGGSCPKKKNPQLPEGFSQRTFESQIRKGGYKVCDQLMHSSLMADGEGTWQCYKGDHHQFLGSSRSGALYSRLSSS